jgi:hypothetical protein
VAGEDDLLMAQLRVRPRNESCRVYAGRRFAADRDQSCAGRSRSRLPKEPVKDLIAAHRPGMLTFPDCVSDCVILEHLRHDFVEEVALLLKGLANRLLQHPGERIFRDSDVRHD